MKNEKFIKAEGSTKENAITAVRLHLELKSEYFKAADKRILRKYGESSTGNSISRDILIPSDMPLHNLHYALQRLFGWQNSHLRKFILPEEIYNKLTGGTVKGWADLVGVLFQPPSEYEDDIFWDDDYENGSIKTWLKKKYTGPFVYRGIMENLEYAKKDMKELIDHFPIVNVLGSFADYMNDKTKNKSKGPRIIKKAPFIELTIDELHNSICIEGGTDHLLERLEIAKVLAYKDEDVYIKKKIVNINDGNNIFPVAHEIIYNYDFGDNWEVTITKEKDCSELLENGYITSEELHNAETTVFTKYKPVCIHKDGIFVLDDVGGLHGFVEFLSNIYENDDIDDRDEHLTWAQGLGWSKRKISNEQIL